MCLTLIWSRSRGGAIAVALFALAQTSSSWAQTNATRLAESVATPPSQTAPSPHTQLGAPFLADTAPSSTNAAGENSQLPSFTLPSFKDWAPTIGAIIAALITFVGVIYTVNRSVASSGFQRANEAEIKDIDAKLHVYGRLIHLLARDHMFAQDLRERQRKKIKTIACWFICSMKSGGEVFRIGIALWLKKYVAQRQASRLPAGWGQQRTQLGFR